MAPKCEPMTIEKFKFAEKYYVQDIAKRKGYVICKDHVLSGVFADEVESISEFEIYDDDIWICSFPKSGTTWTQEMVWCIMNDCEAAKERKLDARYSFIDVNFLVDKGYLKNKNPEAFEELVSNMSWESLTKKQRPRFIKTHLPFDLLPEKLQRSDRKAKIIYVIRNPRDACISLYHQRNKTGSFDGTLEEFAELFIRDLIIYGPYWNHILSYWNQRQTSLLIIHYEDMKKDLPAAIRRVSKFLEKDLTPDEIATLANHLTFDSMKQNPQVNALSEVSAGKNQKYKLLRSGKVNEWKETISDDLKEKFERWEIVNLKNTDYPLNYDI